MTRHLIRVRWFLAGSIAGFAAGVLTTVRALGQTPGAVDLRRAGRETLADALAAASRLVRPPRRRRLRSVPDR